MKYGNVKFAMLDQLRYFFKKISNQNHFFKIFIRNPPLGFEDVVKRHFYFKKNEILACCDKWFY